MTPVFSIITPVYNCEKFVNRCYSVIKMQTFIDWEWVVVDDGSTDRTLDFLKKIKDNRIRLISYKPNKGRGYARTCAINACRGEWVVVWDIDDMHFPDRLAKINQARIEKYDFFCSYAIVVNNDLQIKGVRGFIPASGCLPEQFVHPTLACRTDIMCSIGYDPIFHTGEDFTIILTLSRNYRGCFFDDVLTIYQEDREVNLIKAIACNKSQLSQLQNMYYKGMLKCNFISYLYTNIKWRIKLFLLFLMHINPNLYLRTIDKRSYGEKLKGWRLTFKQISFIKKLQNY